jgi:hypothetical protein
VWRLHRFGTDTDRLYGSRKNGRRGLIQVEEAYKEEIVNIGKPEEDHLIGAINDDSIQAEANPIIRI